MRWAPALLPILIIAGCAKTPEVPDVPVAPVTVNKGTRVPLLLAKQLNAGEADSGDYVPFLVAEDVVSEGRIVIPKGTLVEGEVTWSRSEGTLSGFMNQPARLEVKIKSLQIGEKSVALATSEEDPEKAFAFTRDNTGRPSTDDTKVDEVLKDELNRQLAEKLTELFDGKSPDLSTPDSKLALQKIAGEMGLNDTKRLLNGGQDRVSQLATTIERLQKGDLQGVASGDLSLSLNSVMELANLVGGLGDKLSRTLKGRTIRAYPGTRIEVVIAEPFTT